METQLYLKSGGTFSPDWYDLEVLKVTPGSTFKMLKKNDFFLLSGKIQKTMGLVVKGLARGYIVDQDGNQITIGFFSEGDYATDYSNFIKQQPSRYIIQCLEPTTFLCLSLKDLQTINRHSAKFENYHHLIAEEILNKQQARLESFVFQTAEQRYIDFVKHYPKLFNRISLSHLCSYLGIERQTLTRIRHKLASKRF
jgi:CRP-like cAMP-binding protein